MRRFINVMAQKNANYNWNLMLNEAGSGFFIGKAACAGYGKTP
jgi:hypothetical protein